MKKKKIELLSPAGDSEKLRFALLYGADAVYCALDRFGLRAASGNLTFEEMSDSVKYAHSIRKKVYITLNSMPGDTALDELPEYLKFLAQIKPDAYIVSDPGVMDMVFKHIPDPVIHISTQANTINSRSCMFWYRNGAKRIVLARELSLDDIRRIRDRIPDELELECFVHGAMCISYSGRCLLSGYYTGRDANMGSCAQPCRWKYYVTEEKRTEDAVEIHEDADGTYLFSSKDTCMIEHIPLLAEAGIDSFKIEGRVKSVYYTAAVTNAYRMALDAYSREGSAYSYNPDWRRETESVSHRELGTGYFFDDVRENSNTVTENIYYKDKAFLATVSLYDEESGLSRCIQRNKISKGDKANLLSPGTVGRNFTVDALYDIQGNEIASAPHAKMEFLINAGKTKPGDIIRAVI